MRDIFRRLARLLLLSKAEPAPRNIPRPGRIRAKIEAEAARRGVPVEVLLDPQRRAAPDVGDFHGPDDF